MNEDLIQKFGFSEMYEWVETPDSSMRLGRFVQFDETKANKIVLAGTNNNPVVGVTTVNSAIDSDDPKQWKYAYMCNEYGDLYLRKEKLAVGQKIYDQYLEMNYIKTQPWEHFIPIPNQHWRQGQNYTKRSVRQEWAKVNMLGKVIVKDDGKCIPGKYCMPYQGKLKQLFGTAVEATEDATTKYYVLERISENTILILNK